MAEARYTIVLSDLAVATSIGIHPHERAARQRLLVSVRMTATYPEPPADRIEAVIDYDALRTGIQALVADRHFELQETLCEAVAALAFGDARVEQVWVRTAKPDVYPDATVGCEIERRR